MWEFPGGPLDGRRYLVIGLGSGEPADIALPSAADELIAFGPLLSDNGRAWLGTAMLVRASDADVAHTVVTADRYASIEVHNWQFGGRS